MFEIKNGMSKESIEERGDDHVGSSATTPLRADAFDISDADKIEKIQENNDLSHTLVSTQSNGFRNGRMIHI